MSEELDERFLPSDWRTIIVFDRKKYMKYYKRLLSKIADSGEEKLNNFEEIGVKIGEL